VNSPAERRRLKRLARIVDSGQIIVVPPTISGSAPSLRSYTRYSGGAVENGVSPSPRGLPIERLAPSSAAPRMRASGCGWLDRFEAHRASTRGPWRPADQVSLPPYGSLELGCGAFLLLRGAAAHSRISMASEVTGARMSAARSCLRSAPIRGESFHARCRVRRVKAAGRTRARSKPRYGKSTPNDRSLTGRGGTTSNEPDTVNSLPIFKRQLMIWLRQQEQ
jgi:hypothetical protein